MPLHTKMLIGFLVGLFGGIAAYTLAADAPWLNALIDWVTYPAGQIFLRLLFMLVVPLVFSALVLGVIEIGDVKSLGRIGGRTLLWILLVTALAALIGLVAVNLLQPGRGLPPEVAQSLMEQGSMQASDIAARGESVRASDLLLNMVPRSVVDAAARNDLIGLILFALLVGLAAAVIRSPATEAFRHTVQGLYEISLKLIEWVIRLAPYAVAALLFTITARLGWDVLAQLARYVGTVVLALAVHMFVVFPILLRTLGGVSPLWFFRQIQPVMLTAFSTSSSSATLPTTLKAAEERLGAPRHVARFVCTLGATANMNGTALFEGVTVLFLAQFFGVELTLLQQLLVLVLCILGSVGAAGVPGGSLPVIAMILAMFGIPPEGIGLILGVDRFLDMCRTTVNVGGDLVGTMVIARGESATGGDVATVPRGGPPPG
ncbi:MAG: dicarboxylate/amino acid:cation symporter [Pseudoxanthomonas sp.]|nr:dicarboxylate/amino acid:cation symporter [Pseudoxanthomonas sp.]